MAQEDSLAIPFKATFNQNELVAETRIMYTPVDGADSLLLNSRSPQFEVQEKSEEHHKHISVFWSVWNLTNDILGSAAICLPYTLAGAGIGLGPILMVLYAYLCFESLVLMQKICDKFHLHTFIEMSQLALGRFGFYVASFAIFIANWGGAVGVLIMLGTIGPDLLIQFFGDHELFQRTPVLIFATVIVSPLAYFKNLRRFAIASLLAVWVLLAIFLAIMIRCVLSYENIVWTKPILPSNYLNFTQGSIFGAIGGMSFIFSCSDMSIHIIRSLENPTPKRWAMVAAGTMGLSCIIGGAFAVAGYFLFFTDVKANILDNYNRSDIMAIALRFALCFNVIATFPFNCFMPRVTFLSLFKLFAPNWVDKKPDNKFQRNLLHFCLTTFIIGTALITAISVENLGVFYSFVGSICSITISLLIPGVSYLILIRDEPLVNFKASLLIGFGLVGLVGNVVSFATSS